MTLLTLNEHFMNTLRHINDQGIPEDCALYISPCQGIYTVGMSRSIDIVFLDSDMRVIKIYRSFPPNCFVEPVAGAVSAVELPADCLSRTGTSVGDVLVIDPG
jgi:hypothetical protein